MSDSIIRVENLSKKYFIAHQEQAASYKTFRGAMTNAAKSLVAALNPRAKKEAEVTKEEFWALKDVSFEIKQGDCVGFIGRNGAGKSTLLKILSRITEPTRGSITIKGRVASLLEVGTGFHPELTGRENIFLNGAILGMSKAEIQRKFDEIVAFAEIEKFLDTPVKRYSSGMYVRLAFAVAAHLEPEILIVDEVLAVGDAQFQKKCLGKMGDVTTKEGRTVLFVSHNMAAMRSLCSTGVLLNSGKVVLTGEIDMVADEYLKMWIDHKSRQSKKYGTRFIEVSIQDENGENLEILDLDKKAYLNFQIYVEDNRDLNLGFTVYKHDIPILSSSALDSLEELPKGLSELKIELPINLLTTGEYRVEGAMWNHTQVYDQDDYLTSFKMYRNSALEVRGTTYRGILAFSGSWTSKVQAHTNS
ncbi:polysaccharide ABC transporter ATP-binding protein [Scytonema sp. PCC 10023]|uniref:ABC transporter ATP-binding protein n=1 Tax=Scytonema sp. PCC 10023 TaxID=1680591 RepID=UPI0039C603D7